MAAEVTEVTETLMFDLETLTTQLALLPLRMRVAYALSCAERLSPFYVSYSQRTGLGVPQELEHMREEIWNHVLDDNIKLGQATRLARCLELIPSDEPWVAEQPYAEDAVSALSYAMREIEAGDPADAAWAARCACDCIEEHLMTTLGIDEPNVLLHPLVQLELQRQRRDLSELSSRPTDVQLHQLRDRARDEAGLGIEAGS
jgi:uncharacterized protein YjaG (DUF416 family)